MRVCEMSDYAFITKRRRCENVLMLWKELTLPLPQKIYVFIIIENMILQHYHHSDVCSTLLISKTLVKFKITISIVSWKVLM